MHVRGSALCLARLTSISVKLLVFRKIIKHRDGVAHVPRLDARVGAHDGVPTRQEEVEALAVRLDEDVGVRERLTGEAKTVVLGVCDGHHVVCFWKFALDSYFYRDLVREFAHVQTSRCPQVVREFRLDSKNNTPLPASSRVNSVAKLDSRTDKLYIYRALELHTQNSPSTHAHTDQVQDRGPTSLCP